MWHFIVYCAVKCRALFCDAAVKESTVCCRTSLTTLTHPRSATNTGTVSWGRLLSWNICEANWQHHHMTRLLSGIILPSAGADFLSSCWRIHRNVLHCSFFSFFLVILYRILCEPVFQPAKFESWIRNRGDPIDRSEEYRQQDIRFLWKKIQLLFPF